MFHDALVPFAERRIIIMDKDELRQRTFDCININENQQIKGVDDYDEDSLSGLEQKSYHVSQKSKASLRKKTMNSKVINWLLLVGLVFVAIIIGVNVFIGIKTKKYVNSVRNEAKNMIENGDYEAAINLYKSAEKRVPEGEFNDDIEKLSQHYKELLEEKASKEYSSGKYGDSIKTYKAISTYFNDDSYNGIIEEIIDTYISPQISICESFLKDGNTIDALKILDEAETEIGYCKQIAYERNRIESFEVFLLSSYPMDNEYDSGIVEVNLEIAEVTAGFMSYQVHELDVENIAKTTYYLGNDYEGFMANISLDEASESILNDEDGIQLKIYGDNNLLYASEVLNNPQQSFDVQLSGLSEYSELTFCVLGVNGSGEVDYYGNYGLDLIIWNPILAKCYVEPGVDNVYEEGSSTCYLYNIAVNTDESDWINNYEKISTFETRYYHFKLHLEDVEYVELSYTVYPADIDRTREYFEDVVRNDDELYISVEWECPEEYMYYGNAFPETITIYRNDTGQQIAELNCTLYR